MNKNHKNTYQDILNISKKFNDSLLCDIKESYGFIFIIGWMASYIVLPILMYIWEIGDFSMLIILWLPLVWIWFFLLYRKINTFIWNIIRRFFKKILNELFSLNEEKITIDSIEDILMKTNKIHKIFWTLHLRKNLLKIVWRYQTKELFINYCNIIAKYLIIVLTDLRSDLSICFKEQQQSLESAKSEVEKNIHWTAELNQVSELQRARLDKQIEQFEELQRVLVKV